MIDCSLTGIIVSGTGKAALFTQLDWVVEQCLEKLGFIPSPGTLNIDISPQDIARLEDCLSGEVIELQPPGPESCSARIIPAALEDIQAAIIIPDAQVRVHGDTIIELLAPVRVKEALKKKDGDRVTVTMTNSISKR
jgi:CTP-dependent riboflavin kinase